jgi:thiamine-monophosphate kinase
MRLGELGEDKLLAKILPHLQPNARVITSAGDDCAVVRFGGAKDLLLLKTDCVVENIHFAPDTDARAVGWKAMMRTLSDFAAMSGIPEFALVTLAIESKRKLSWVEKLYRGLNHAAARFQVAIVGGETSDTRGSTVVGISAAGYVERDRCVWRTGGKANDDLFVTGRLGGSIRSRHLKFIPRIEEARWLTSHFHIHAMIDLSDGLGTDLPRLAHASKLGFVIEQNALPLAPGCSIEQAISNGEDYELLFALSPRNRGPLEKKWASAFPTLPLTRIGHLTAKREIGKVKFRAGYVHFRQRR